jgi:uncharacterized protein
VSAHRTGSAPVAVITGGSSGIGAAIARRLAGGGWHCVLIARGRERLEPLAAELGGDAVVCDVSEREAVDEAAAAIVERHPAIRLLVNSAGLPARTGFLDGDPERIERVTRVNYLGSVWSLRAFLPALERARPADVVNIVSVAGMVAYGPSGPYAASKHAQLAFSRAVAPELRARGVRVHTVSPGFVETEGFPQSTVLRSAFLRRRVVGPERIADHVLDVLRRDRPDTVVPAWYHVAPLVQTLAPGLLARLLARGRYRTIRR